MCNLPQPLDITPEWSFDELINQSFASSDKFGLITTQAKGYPFEVPIQNNPKVSGVILADQAKSLLTSLCQIPNAFGTL
ncbi:MAG: hypothetical protein V1832_01215 [Nitrospirota bacterium]